MFKIGTSKSVIFTIILILLITISIIVFSTSGVWTDVAKSQCIMEQFSILRSLENAVKRAKQTGSVNPGYKLKVMYCTECIWYDKDDSELIVKIVDQDPEEYPVSTYFLGLGCNCNNCEQGNDIDGDGEPDKCANVRKDTTYTFKITKDYAMCIDCPVSSQPCTECECNEDDTGCEEVFCTGCAKCGDYGVCFNGDFNTKREEYGLFPCCEDGDCASTYCMDETMGPLSTGYCEYERLCDEHHWCEGSKDFYCGDNKAECELSCTSEGCTVNKCTTKASCPIGDNCCMASDSCVSCVVDHYGSSQGACVNGRWYYSIGDSELHDTPYIPCCDDNDCPDYECWSSDGSDNSWTCMVSEIRPLCSMPSSDPGRGGVALEGGLSCYMRPYDFGLENYDTCMERCKEIHESL